MDPIKDFLRHPLEPLVIYGPAIGGAAWIATDPNSWVAWWLASTGMFLLGTRLGSDHYRRLGFQSEERAEGLGGMLSALVCGTILVAFYSPLYKEYAFWGSIEIFFLMGAFTFARRPSERRRERQWKEENYLWVMLHLEKAGFHVSTPLEERLQRNLDEMVEARWIGYAPGGGYVALRRGRKRLQRWHRRMEKLDRKLKSR